MTRTAAVCLSRATVTTLTLPHHNKTTGLKAKCERPRVNLVRLNLIVLSCNLISLACFVLE